MTPFQELKRVPGLDIEFYATKDFLNVMGLKELFVKWVPHVEEKI